MFLLSTEKRIRENCYILSSCQRKEYCENVEFTSNLNLVEIDLKLCISMDLWLEGRDHC